MSRSSNQKRKRKARVATGVPCERPARSLFGVEPTTYDYWLNAPLVQIATATPGFSTVIIGVSYDA